MKGSWEELCKFDARVGHSVNNVVVKVLMHIIFEGFNFGVVDANLFE